MYFKFDLDETQLKAETKFEVEVGVELGKIAFGRMDAKIVARGPILQENVPKHP